MYSATLVAERGGSTDCRCGEHVKRYVSMSSEKCSTATQFVLWEHREWRRRVVGVDPRVELSNYAAQSNRLTSALVRTHVGGSMRGCRSGGG